MKRAHYQTGFIDIIGFMVPMIRMKSVVRIRHQREAFGRREYHAEKCHVEETGTPLDPSAPSYIRWSFSY